MRRVIVESPFAGRGQNEPDVFSDGEKNWEYVKDVCRYLAFAGDAPYASHLFCTQFLIDKWPDERKLGMEIGFQWGVCAQACVVAIDRGVSEGMREGIARARANGLRVEWLSLADWADSWLPGGVDRDAWRALVAPGDVILVDK